MALRIGVHPNNLYLVLVQAWADSFADMDVTLVPYAEGRDSAAMLVLNLIDVCGTGSTPPILAQAGGLGVTYLAASAPRPANGGLVVAAGSAIAGIQDLKGARVALLDGSFHTYLLARILDGAGLRLNDVQRVELAPGACLDALQAGAVEAWVAMEPLLNHSVAAGHVRLLARCGDTIPNRSIFWTLRERAVPEDVLDGFVAGLVRLGRRIANAPLQAAEVLAHASAGEADIATWRHVAATRDWSIQPADRQIVMEQQMEADVLLRHDSLERAIDLTAALRPGIRRPTPQGAGAA